MSVAIEIIPYRLPLRRPWRTAHGTHHHRQGWLICAHQSGLSGYGDCAPLPEAGTEERVSAAARLASWQHRAEGAAATINALLDQLQDEQIAPLLPRPKTSKVLDPRPQGQQAAIADPEHGLPSTGFPPQTRCPAADMAIETALLDLQARLQGFPLHQGLQHTADPLRHTSAADSQARAVTTTIAVNAAMGDATALDPDRLRQLIDEGWRVFKFKVGVTDFAREFTQLEIAASLLPTDGRLRLDANGAWTKAQAESAIAALNSLPIDALEEPLQDPDPAILAALQDQARFALALDESLTRWSTQGPMPETANLPARRLVLKPGVIGGLRPCLQLARAAMAAGKEVVITSLIESAAGLWASAQLAAATQSPLAHGLATSDWLAQDLGPPPPINGGQLRLGNQTGSGFHPHSPLFHNQLPSRAC